MAVVLLCLTGLSFTNAQKRDLVFTHHNSIPVKAKAISADHLQNTYVITEDNEVIKYNAAGDVLFRFNDNTQGELTFLDPSNPLNLLLFYPDFQTLIILDRTLSEQTRLNLLDLDIPQVTSMGWSRDNQIWIYDDLNFKLKKINTRKEITASSENLSLILPTVPHPSQICIYGTWVFLNDPAIGLLVFDQFGQYDRTIPITGIQYFQIIGDTLLGSKESGFFQLDLLNGKVSSLELPEKASDASGLYWGKGVLYSLHSESVEIFRFVAK